MIENENECIIDNNNYDYDDHLVSYQNRIVVVKCVKKKIFTDVTNVHMMMMTTKII